MNVNNNERFCVSLETLQLSTFDCRQRKNKKTQDHKSKSKNKNKQHDKREEK